MARMTRTVLGIAILFLAFALLGAPGWAQTGSISGAVVDGSDLAPLPGANVIIEGTETGTTTDAEGEYEISGLDSGAYTVMVTFIGYAEQSQEVDIEAGETAIVNFQLFPRAMEMEEVVTIGYGERRRRDVTGSVASISTQDIMEVPVTDVVETIQGRIAGATVISAGHRPGQGVIMRVRGRRSLTASNDPLFVVDGIPVSGGLDDINPRDIESIEVLKDASATAIYGSRGANGVVLVTTDRGGDHATRVSYSGHVGVSQAMGTPDIMTGEEFAALKEEADRVFTPEEEDGFERGVSTDWVDLTLDNGYQQSHQLSVQGGDANTQFAVSGNFFQESGVITDQGFMRNTLRINLDHSVSDRFRIGTSTQLSRRVQDWGANPYGSALAASPLLEPYDADGELIAQLDPLIYNPLLDLVDDAIVDERARTRIFSNIFLDLDIFENLNYRLNFGPDLQDYRRGVFQSSLSTARQESSPLSSKEHARAFTYTFENILTLTQDFRESHSLDFTGLFSIQESNTEQSDLEVTGLPYEHQQFHNIGSGETIESLGSNLEEWGLMSFMGRANYRLMDRYLLTVTGRFDGSSRLSEEHRWAFFPAVALGWHVSEEPFMLDQDLFSELRLRASYGVAGNTAISPYQTRGGLERSFYNFGGQAGFGFRPASIANPDLRWETSAMVNLGLDFGLFAGRIEGAVEVYQTNTTDLLLERQLPISSGFGSVLENIGETRNRGIEIDLSTRNIDRGNFSWTTDLNLSANREEIVDLYGTGEDDVGNEWFIGEPLTVWYDYDKIGIWQLDEADEAAEFGYEPGEIKVRDTNGDGIINEQDRVILGSDMPTMSIGFGNRFRVHNFDLSIFLFGSFGHMINNDFMVGLNSLQGRYNNMDIDYWTEDNPTNEWPRPDGSAEFPQFQSTLGYTKGDFLKVRNIQLGYTLPNSLLNAWRVQYMRIYANAESPFIFSHLESGQDPEIYDLNNDDGAGTIAAGNSPAYRLFTVGLNITF